MGNFGKFDFVENIQQQDHSIDNILDEIIEFNNEYGFIESYANSVKQKINKLALCDEFFDDDRLKKTEEILRFGTSLEKMWLEIYDYRWEEFYENNRPSAYWNKIWLNIFDWELFKEFISNQTPEVSEKFYTFLFQVILDNAHASDFYWKLKDGEEKNKMISDQLEYLEDLGNINSIYMNNLIEDYKKRSLYQSLLSKFIITNYTPELSISSLQNVQNFSVIEDAWNESFKALKTIMDSESYKNHHETHLRLLAKFLKDCIDNTYTLIFSDLIKAKEDYDSGNKENLYKNNGHKIFVQQFYKKLHSRKYLIEQILSEKKDEN